MSAESRKVQTLDVRALMAGGEQPFPKIMRAIGKLATGDRLLLITPFLPSPLIEKLQSEGFAARPERRGDGSWQTQFCRE
jgi:uncharacterized protein (DUF2249 family)